MSSVRILGKVVSDCAYDHTIYDTSFYRFLVEVERNSGVIDTIPVIAPSKYIDETDDYFGYYFCVDGSIHTHRDPDNNLNVYVLADRITFAEPANINCCNLEGVICNTPKHRITKNGKELTTFMLAVNRVEYGKSDYIPCIAWGLLSRLVAAKKVGDPLVCSGRFQSRESNDKTVYELSIGWISK